ncbi:beta-phosphoglucomutase family hydrolase [Levilactobacillus tujiorum]|uniref:Beta-phosphoglucomutase family hydrolase n=1 Tax=Levilactobacillus tujiorum TaxID=2912243 RepID=A0ABX1L5N6_9LACO|nr:beta-phosphoglucomutase family hydrolase [Levilactobacillus tujiorum]MCH5464651.1 HAD family phosphatase [Levilactobacillus tujiorum]NLR11667.1 beta-phosphoglucomutase family hydrolase [Lactobacillus sp. HBUAS51387]NLR29588.1 beta-phosphoglucomutase family hydrolase [Levilactobacillus tujiorum]
MQPQDVRGFLFDLHGVLADSWQYHLASWQAVAQELQIPWTDQLATTLPGMSRADSLQAILASAGRQNEFNAHQRQMLTDHENTLYKQFVAALTPANRLPGITAFLDELVAAGYPLALASASANAPAEIKHLGLTPYFPQIVPASSLRASKPAPDVYLAAAGLIHQHPEDCVAFEDTVTGVRSAKAAGCFTIGINSQKLPQADAMFASTRELSIAAVQRVLGQLNV